VSTAQVVPCTAHASVRHWHHPCEAGFAGMQNARVSGVKKAFHRFQRKAWEARQYLVGLGPASSPQQSDVCM
jgi:hypothetical protein